MKSYKSLVFVNIDGVLTNAFKIMHNVYNYDYHCVVYHSLRKDWTLIWWIKQMSDSFVVEIVFSSIFWCSLRNPVCMRRTFSKMYRNIAFFNISWRNEKENATYYLFLMTRCFWKTSTRFTSGNDFSIPLRWRSTKAFRCRCPCSRWAMLAILCSPSSSSCSSCFCSYGDSGIRSVNSTRRLGTWNSIGMTASNPNVIQKRVDCMLVLNVVRYTRVHSGVCHPNSFGFRSRSFWGWSAIFYSWIQPNHSPKGSTVCFSYVLSHNVWWVLD